MRKEVIFGLIFITCGSARALPRWIGVTGSVGTYGEVYRMRGRDPRRDPTTGRMYVRPVLTVFGTSFPFEVLVSTEETKFRQPFNRFGISPRWKWATFHLGDFSPRFSQLTLNGVALRGGGVELSPWPLRLAVVVGRSQRAVVAVGGMGAYRRTLWAVKVGLGGRTGNFLDLVLIRAADDTSSVDSVGVAPQENLVVGVNGQVRLSRARSFLRWEAAGSVHTRDLRSSELEDVPVPEGIRRFYTLRLSTKVDYAYRIEAGFRLPRVGFQVGYGRIGPGFVSLGVSSAVNDRRRLSLRTNVEVVEGKFRFRGHYTRYRDNLKGQKQHTTVRESASLSLEGRPARAVGLGMRYSRNTVGNDSENDTTKVDVYSDRYTLNASFDLKLLGVLNSLRTSFSVQRSERRNPVRPVKGFDVRSFTVGLNSRVSDGLSLSPSVGLTSNRASDGTRSSTYIYSLSVDHSALRRKLSDGLRMSLKRAGDASSLNLNLSGRLRLTSSDALTLKVRMTRYEHGSDPGRGFREVTAGLGFDHRF